MFRLRLRQVVVRLCSAITARTSTVEPRSWTIFGSASSTRRQRAGGVEAVSATTVSPAPA